MAILHGMNNTDTIAVRVWDSHGHTFGAHPAACAAADEVLRLIDEEDLLLLLQALTIREAATTSAPKTRTGRR